MSNYFWGDGGGELETVRVLKKGVQQERLWPMVPFMSRWT